MHPDLEYYASERFIHDGLLIPAEEAIKNTVKAAWKRDGRITPFILCFPQEPVPSDDGKFMIQDCAFLDLPEDRRDVWTDLLVQVIQKGKPYALLKCEQVAEEILAIFESQHGTRSWRWPIKMHGRTAVLGDVSSRDDVDSIGVLWSSKKANA